MANDDDEPELVIPVPGADIWRADPAKRPANPRRQLTIRITRGSLQIFAPWRGERPRGIPCVATAPLRREQWLAVAEAALMQASPPGVVIDRRRVDDPRAWDDLVRQLSALVGSCAPPTGIAAIEAELRRLGILGPTGIECEPGPGPENVTIYDTQEPAIYRIDDAVRALSGAPAGGGFEAAWHALGTIDEVTTEQHGFFRAQMAKLDRLASSPATPRPNPPAASGTPRKPRRPPRRR